ncbi:MAG: PAS domain S-box protein, partial [Geobacteraceae bacterium]
MRFEAELRNSETRLNAVIQGSPIPQFVIDKEHKVLHWNDALQAYSGILSGEVIGTNQHWRAFYPEERPCLADLLLDSKLERIPAWYEGKYSPSSLVEGAYEATDFFPHMGKTGTWLHFTAAPIWNESGTIIGAIETLEDITDRVHAENALQHSEEKYRLIADYNYDWEFWVDNDGNYIYNSPSCERVTGYSADEFSQDPSLMSKIVISDDRGMYESHLAEVLSSSVDIQHLDFRIVKKNGDVRWINHYCQPVYGQTGSPLGRRGSNRDITERKLAEKALTESEAKYRTLFDKTKDAVLIIENNQFVDCNAAALRMMGYATKDELFQIHPSKISPPTQPDGRSSFEKAEELMAITLQEGSNRFEWMHRRANGEDFWVEVSLTAIPFQDHQIIHTAWRDITDRKIAEEKIQRSLEEKEILLKEIHHRVKNNLQVVWGLIDLQIQNVKDQNIISILRDSQNRIRTMSLIHETLYKSHDLSHIEISPYLRNLITTLFSTYSISPEKIQVHFDIEEVLLDVESAIP